MTDKLTREDIETAAAHMRGNTLVAPSTRQAMDRVASWLAAMPSAEALSMARDYAIDAAVQERAVADHYAEGPRRQRCLSEAAELDAVATWLKQVE
jgi:hypothetical protein